MALSDKEKNTVKEALALIERETDKDGDKLTLKGFGTFQRKRSEARTARNPATGGSVEVPAKSKLSFKASPVQLRIV